MLGSFSVTKLLGSFLTLGYVFSPVELVSDEANAAAESQSERGRFV